MLIHINLNIILSVDLEEAEATLKLSSFLLAAKKKTIIVSFRWDISVFTAARTAGAVMAPYARECLLVLRNGP